MPIYFASALFCLVVSFGCGRKAERVAASALLANGIANEAYVRLTGDFTPWMWFLATDTLTCLFLSSPERIVICGREIKIPQSGIIGAILAATYATQIIMHLSYGVSASAQEYTYWQSLTAMAWLQLLILFIGGSIDGCARVADRLRSHFSVAPKADFAFARQQEEERRNSALEPLRRK